MENVFTVLLQSCIPQELHFTIYMYAGLCTPSCSIIKMFLEKLKGKKLRIKTKTLWGAIMSFAPVNLLTRWKKSIKLHTDQDMDLQIAFHQMSCEAFIEISEKEGMDETVQNQIRNGFKKAIRKIRKGEQTIRLHDRYRRDVNQDLIEKKYNALKIEKLTRAYPYASFHEKDNSLP